MLKIAGRRFAQDPNAKEMTLPEEDCDEDGDEVADECNEGDAGGAASPDVIYM